MNYPLFNFMREWTISPTKLIFIQMKLTKLIRYQIHDDGLDSTFVAFFKLQVFDLS